MRGSYNNQIPSPYALYPSTTSYLRRNTGSSGRLPCRLYHIYSETAETASLHRLYKSKVMPSPQAGLGNTPRCAQAAAAHQSPLGARYAYGWLRRLELYP